MVRRATVGMGILVGLVLACGLVQAAQVRTSRTTAEKQTEGYYLSGNLEVREVIYETREGRAESETFGSIRFFVPMGDEGTSRMQLESLNLVGEGFKTERGETGTIGISLAEAVEKVEYNPRTGEIHAPLVGTLHYELIDRIRGYRPQECKGECDRFESYVETVQGELIGRFQEPLQPAEDGKNVLDLEIKYELAEEVLGVIHQIRVIGIIVVNWTLFQSSEALRIQPVFVGSGPSDPNASGTAFNTLMSHSHDMWNRCASVRCLKFLVNDPIYVNNNAYRILDHEAEAIAFKGTVDVANAVEVFVAAQMSTSLACSWGGGACFSLGTASAKVVSCDQQMAVPCPCPSACSGYCPCGSCLCGAINPYHLAHELGHALNLPHPSGAWSTSTVNSIMEPSGFCCDNPNAQSAKNCRNASNPLLFVTFSVCIGTPDIHD